MVREQTEAERHRDGPWQWGDLVQLYRDAKLPTLKPRWAMQFERHLRWALDDLAQRDAAQVGRTELVKVRDRIAASGSPSAVADTVEAVKVVLDWAGRHRAPRTGLQHVEYPWWCERLTVDWSSTPWERTPTLPELGRTLALAERHKALGSTGKETASACWRGCGR